MKVTPIFICVQLLFISAAHSQSSDNQVKIIKNFTNISSIKDLLFPFKGTPVFIDLWASWCEPCKDEFKFSPELYNQLTKRRIKIIYISIDKDNQDSTWKADIYRYKLDGYHLKASKALRDELTTLVWGGIDIYSIPQYLLFDPDGKLIAKEISAPSTTIALYHQIDEIFK
jgi:thiol-disulfide isomerase/thioredoxin